LACLFKIECNSIQFAKTHSLKKKAKMNAPLIDRTPTDNVSRLEAELESGRPTIQSIRSAMIRCSASDSSPVEERLAVAAAHIVCTPGQLQRSYADRIRGDLLSMNGSDRALASHYSKLAIATMKLITAHMGNGKLTHEEKLRTEYASAIKAEEALLKALEHERVPV
jgi:hypothetical protein